MQAVSTFGGKHGAAVQHFQSLQYLLRTYSSRSHNPSHFSVLTCTVFSPTVDIVDDDVIVVDDGVIDT